VPLFDEDEVERGEDGEVEDVAPHATVTAPERARKRREPLPAHLPREEIVHDLSDAEKVCPHDGAALRMIGTETSEQLEIIPAQIKVLRHVRYSYACPCCEQHIVTAAKPKQPIEKSLAAPGLLAHIATQKYVDALPLYRQTEIFQRIGITFNRGTLANWMVACGQLMQPLIHLIHDRMIDQTVLHMDETRVQVLSEPGRIAQQDSFMWVLRSIEHPAVLYRYEPSCSGEIPKQLLGDDRGALMVDGYDGDNAVCTAQGLVRLGCWAHVRRKFIDAQKAQAKPNTGKADQALAFIQALYRIEQLAKDTPVDERHAMRQTHAQPILDKIRQWMEKSLPNTPPQT
jgi:transposase